MPYSDYVLASLLVIVGVLIGRILSKQVVRYLVEKYTVKNSMIFQRGIFYTIILIFVVIALNLIGVDIGVILGAAGIFTVALGFASQTSMSNVISGMFLVGENAFSVGDLIQVGQTTGEVISIDWISVKLRTLDNRYVRIPNELLIKTEVININRFKIRRYDLNFSVTTDTDLDLLRKSLLELATNDVQCLIEPEPMVVYEGFTSSGINLRFSVWTKTDNFVKFRSQFTEATKKLLDSIEIAISFPHVSVVGTKTEKALVASAHEVLTSQTQNMQSNKEKS